MYQLEFLQMQTLRQTLIWLLQAPIQVYRRFISPWLGMNCRFSPSCSAYALEALEVHGPIKGLWLAARRILRCHPLGGFGDDPVPPKPVPPKKDPSDMQ